MEGELCILYNRSIMVKSLFITALLVFSTGLHAQDLDKHVYDPSADAENQLTQAIDHAAKEGKHVLVQIGGNWCVWCLRLNNLFHSNARIDSMLKADYIVVHLNYSEENRNLGILARYGYPQRFGFPVLLVLDGFGKLLHTQDSGLLEEGKGHSPEKVLTFLRNWAPGALRPEQYLKQ